MSAQEAFRHVNEMLTRMNQICWHWDTLVDVIKRQFHVSRLTVLNIMNISIEQGGDFAIIFFLTFLFSTSSVLHPD